MKKSDTKSPSELTKELAQGIVAPVYLFTGEEEFLMETSVGELKRLVVATGFEDFDYDLFYGGEHAFSEMLEKLQSPPFGSKKRLVVIKHTKRFTLTEREALTLYVQSPNPNTCLVVVAPKDQAPEGLVTAIKKYASVIHFYPLRDYEISTAISARARAQGLSLEPGAAELIRELVGNSLSNVNSELEKLKIFLGAESRVSQELIAEVSAHSRSYQVYDLSQTIGSRNRKKALEILCLLKNWEEESTWIVSAIAREFFDLFVIKTLPREPNTAPELAQLLGKKVLVATQLSERSRNWTRAEIVHCLRQLKAIDIQIKQGRKDPFYLLESFITEHT